MRGSAVVQPQTVSERVNMQSKIEIMLEFHKKMREAHMKTHKGDYPTRGDVMGYFGELVVRNELKKREIPYTAKGGQGGYDILANGKKLEVRTSQLKQERCFPKHIKAWGWKLQARDVRKDKKPVPLKYDLISLVKLNDDWDQYDIFLFSKEEVEKMDEIHYGGYQTVARGIYLFPDKIEKVLPDDKNEMISGQCVEFNWNPKAHLIDWKKFS